MVGWWGRGEAKEIHQHYRWLASSQALPLKSCVTCSRSLNLYELLISEVGTRLRSLQSWCKDWLTLQVWESPSSHPLPTPNSVPRLQGVRTAPRAGEEPMTSRGARRDLGQCRVPPSLAPGKTKAQRQPHSPQASVCQGSAPCQGGSRKGRGRLKSLCLSCRHSKCPVHDGIWRCQARVGKPRAPELCSIIKDKPRAFPEPQVGHLQKEVAEVGSRLVAPGSLCPLSSEVPSPWHRLRA